MSKAPSSTNQELVFYGMDGVEAEEFIRSVLKAAKVAGRLRDDSWILDEVYVAFAGDALRWYIELDVETRNDWLLLQRAIMQKYSPPSQRSWRGGGPSTSSQPLTVPIPAAAAPLPSSFALTSAPGKYFYIRAEREGSSSSLYVGIKSGAVRIVTSRSEGVTIRHDRQTKELRVIQTPGLTDTGEKFEIRQSARAYKAHPISHGPWIPVARLQLVDAQGLPKGWDPVQDGDSFSSWNVTDENILQAIPRNGSRYPIKLYLDLHYDENLYPPIGAYVGGPSGRDTSCLRFLTLRLEEI